MCRGPEGGRSFRNGPKFAKNGPKKAQTGRKGPQIHGPNPGLRLVLGVIESVLGLTEMEEATCSSWLRVE